MSYSAEQWTAVAAEMGETSRPVREELERLGGLFLQYPDRLEERAEVRSRLESLKAIRTGFAETLSIMDAAGFTAEADGSSLALRKEIADYDSGLSDEIKRLEQSLPSTRSDKGRTWLLRALCHYWFGILQRTDIGGRIAGQPDGPLYRFLMAATAPYFPKNQPLTAEAATHAVDEARGRQRGKKVPALLTEMAFSRYLPDEFDLACMFDDQIECEFPMKN